MENEEIISVIPKEKELIETIRTMTEGMITITVEDYQIIDLVNETSSEVKVTKTQRM